MEFVFLPEHFGIREAYDVGMYAQTLMLSMTAHGLACCPQTALIFVSDPVRETMGILDADNSSRSVWADSAYRSQEREDSLREAGYRSHIHRKGARGQTLNDRAKEANRKR